MPIRVVKDDDNSSESNFPSGGGRRGFSGGGGGGLGSLLPIVIGLFGKRPKLLIILLIIGGAFYLFKGGCSGGSMLQSQQDQNLSTGATLDAAKFDETEVFEALDDEINLLPERVSLEQYCPPRLNQGRQGSCVAWSHAYAARSIMYAMQTGKQPEACAFSPSFLYNQISLQNCQGAYIPNAMEKMTGQGLVPFSDFPYDDGDCSREPGNDLKQKAATYKIKGFQRLTNGDAESYGRETINLRAIRQNLAQNAPVTIGMMVGGTFMSDMMGKEVWIPSQEDYDMSGFGGHAMCVIGYDDYKEGGAFQLMNSWGPEWGNNGIAWVRYKDFEFFTREAYGLYPMGKSGDRKFAAGHLQAAFGLTVQPGGEDLDLEKISGISFRSRKTLQKGVSKFKIKVRNDAECYTYVYGLETDASVKGLFPYTLKHSPYCGIMGTRLFPRDYSLQPDEVGDLDYFVIIVSKQPIDYVGIKTKLSKAVGSLEQKVRKVFGSLLAEPEFKVSTLAEFDIENAAENTIVAMVMEIPKK
jgi:C1A family cysteine protease